MNKYIAVAGVVFLCAACASAPKPANVAEPGGEPTSEETEGPKDARALLEEVIASNPMLTEMWQREATTKLPQHTITLPGQGEEPVVISLQANNVSVPEGEKGQLHSFAVDVGSQQPLNCYYLPRRVDTAATMRMVGKSVTSVIPVEDQLPAAIDVEVVAGAPVISMEVGYFIEQNGDRAMGTFKAHMGVFPTSTLWCSHDDLGYRQTVRDTVESMFTSLMKASEARYSEQFKRRRVSIAYFSGQAAGYSEDWVMEAETGTTVISYTSTLMSRGPGSYGAEDTVITEHSDAEGYLFQQSKVTSENGELTLQMELARADDGRYQAQGTLQGKPVEFDLGSEHKLPGTVLEEKTIKRFVADNPNGATTTHYTYAAGLAPDQLLPIHFEIVDARKRQLKVNMGGLEMAVWSDGHGRPNKSVADLGAIELVIEHKYTHPDR